MPDISLELPPLDALLQWFADEGQRQLLHRWSALSVPTWQTFANYRDSDCRRRYAPEEVKGADSDMRGVLELFELAAHALHEAVEHANQGLVEGHYLAVVNSRELGGAPVMLEPAIFRDLELRGRLQYLAPFSRPANEFAGRSSTESAHLDRQLDGAARLPRIVPPHLARRLGTPVFDIPWRPETLRFQRRLPAQSLPVALASTDFATKDLKARDASISVGAEDVSEPTVRITAAEREVAATRAKYTRPLGKREPADNLVLSFVPALLPAAARMQNGKINSSALIRAAWAKAVAKQREEKLCEQHTRLAERPGGTDNKRLWVKIRSLHPEVQVSDRKE